MKNRIMSFALVLLLLALAARPQSAPAAAAPTAIPPVASEPARPPDRPGSAVIFRGGADRRGYFEGPDFPQAPKRRWREKKGDHAASGEVAVAGGRLFFATIYGKLFAFNTEDGDKLWKAGSGHSPIAIGYVYIPGGPPIHATPTLDGNTLLYTHRDRKQGFLIALDQATGEELWKYTAPGVLTGSPVPGEDNLLIATDAGELLRLDKKSRSVVWRSEIGRLVARDITVSGDSVLACTERGLVHTALKDGALRWTHKLGGLYCTTPVVADGVAVVTLQTAAEKTYPNPRPSVAKAIVAIRLSDAELLWKADASRTPRIPAIADGVVYFCPGNSYFYAVELQTGKERWHTWLKGGLETSNPSLTAKSIYFTTDDRSLLALDRANGKVRWVLDKEFSVDIAPVPSGDRIYIITQLGAVMALQ